MSNLGNFWRPQGRGPRKSALSKPAKVALPPKKKYTKLKVTLVLSEEAVATTRYELEPCDVANFATYLWMAHREDAKQLYAALRIAVEAG